MANQGEPEREPDDNAEILRTWLEEDERRFVYKLDRLADMQADMATGIGEERARGILAPKPGTDWVNGEG